jgi:replication factor C large subunit
MANDLYSKRITGLKTRCELLKINKVHTNSIMALLKRICVKEGVDFEEHVIRNLAKRSRGDLRSAINDLEVLASGNNTITNDDLEILSEKDQVNNIFDSVRTVLKSKNPRRVRDALRLEADPAFILELVAENIPREYEKQKEIEKAYDMIADADLFLGRAFNTRNYGYWKYSYDLMGIGVSLAKDDTYRKFTRYSNSSMYSYLSRNRAKRDLRDRVASKIGEKLHTSRKVAIEQFPYFEILFQKDDLAYQLAQFFDLDDGDVKQFRKRKIKIPKDVKSAAKNKVKKSGKRKEKPVKPKSIKKSPEIPKKVEKTPKNNEKKLETKDKDKQSSLFNF